GLCTQRRFIYVFVPKTYPYTPSTLSLHDALPIFARYISEKHDPKRGERGLAQVPIADVLNIYLTDVAPHKAEPRKIAARAIRLLDRKSTRLNSSHVKISYAVFCLKKKTILSSHKT